MTIKSIKTTGLSFAFAAALLVAAGAANTSTASAQVPNRFDHDRDGRFNNDRDGRFNNDRDGRMDTRRERVEEWKGYNAGLTRGKADALAHRRFNPVILQRRFVSNDYREGFRKGYAQAYSQFAKNNGRRNGRGY